MNLKKVLPLILVSIFNNASADLVFEVGAGKNGTFLNVSPAVPWEDQGGIGAYLGLRYEQDTYTCHIIHLSQWDVGPPLNNENESSVNHIGCAIRIH